ncbi:hypothetical protein CAPTEDRAFT_221426 [Capitella teleta]|uniref:Uncharacterized protein n=1 Tax=Capitella teleta TaxID=283909 RepID=R7UVB8_CAPTE|nr:hypothetical protein CAPTEDRAFT_221426 [Capitella teleta]|eukprot:ELU10058.1 hypothetical protein CAPTEDRAFT_221426 [Capitella teleta]
MAVMKLAGHKMASNTDLESGKVGNEDINVSERNQPQHEEASSSEQRSELDHTSTRAEKAEEVPPERVKFTLETHEEDEEGEEEEAQNVIAQMESEAKPTQRRPLLHSQSEIRPAPKKRFHLSSTSSDTVIPSLKRNESTNSRFQVSRAPEDTQLHKSQSEAISNRLISDITSEPFRKPARRTASARILSDNRPPPLSRPRCSSEGPGCDNGIQFNTETPLDESELCRDHKLMQSIKVKVDGPEYNLRYPRMDWWAEDNLPPRPKDFTVLSCMVLICCNPLLGAVGCFFALKSEGAYKEGKYPDSIKFSRLSLYLSVFGIILTLTVTITVLVVLWPDVPPRQ